MKLPVVGDDVTRVEFDYAIAFLTESGGQVKIETPFVLIGEDQARKVIDPPAPGTSAVDVLRVLRQKIVRADFTDEGHLRLEIGTVMSIEVDPHDSFEAWNFADSRGVKVVCLPGGGVATWGMV
jgi:hypothetical protein